MPDRYKGREEVFRNASRKPLGELENLPQTTRLRGECALGGEWRRAAVEPQKREDADFERVRRNRPDGGSLLSRDVGRRRSGEKRAMGAASETVMSSMVRAAARHELDCRGK